jgi:hypothetical protein
MEDLTMNETVRIWFENLYRDAIEEARETIKNEHLWELGYNGEEPNPHTGNIEMLMEYIEVLEEKLAELN